MGARKVKVKRSLILCPEREDGNHLSWKVKALAPSAASIQALKARGGSAVDEAFWPPVVFCFINSHTILLLCSLSHPRCDRAVSVTPCWKRLQGFY